MTTDSIGHTPGAFVWHQLMTPDLDASNGTIQVIDRVLVPLDIPGLTRTIPLAIYEYTSTPGGDRMALSLCLVSVALSFLVLLIGEAANRSLARR